MKKFVLFSLVTVLFVSGCYRSGEARLIDLKYEVPVVNGWVWYGDDDVTIKVLGANGSDVNLKDSLTLRLFSDTGDSLMTISKLFKIKLQSRDSIFFTLNPDPGFYRVTLESGLGEIKSFTIGYEPEKIISPYDAQEDFAEFWKRAKSDLSKVRPQYKMTLLKDKSTSERKTYLVTMRSLDNVEISGYYVTPTKPGKYPAIIHFMGYGSKPWAPDPAWDNGFVEFVLSVRGQGLNEPDNIYGDWITYNLDNPEKYYYRGAFMDLIRGVDFLVSQKEVDNSLIFAEGSSQGGAFTLISAALDKRIRAACAGVPFLSDYPDYFRIVQWPAAPVLAKQRELGLNDVQLYQNLSYFDVKNFAGLIECPVFMGYGLQDGVCPPHTNFAGYNLITSPKRYQGYPDKAHSLGEGWWQEMMSFINSNMNK